MNVLVTGASTGFGEAVSRRFAASGHRVVALGRREPLLQKLKGLYPHQIEILVGDVRDSKFIQECGARFGSAPSGVDILVNNAGLALGMDLAQDATPEDWETMIDTNIKGLLHCTRAFLPGMIARGRGHVINIGSVAGEFPYPRGNVYGATKAFVHQFSLNLRADLLGTPVRVTCIEPGMAGGSEFSEVRFKGDRAKASAVYEGISALTPDDIAEAVQWVAERPAHVNINTISLMPVQQAFGPLAVHRRTTS